MGSLHRDFLGSEDKYRACEQYWQRLVDTACAETATLGQWHRWIPRFRPDGQAFQLREFELDGNPIFDGRSYATNRAFRISQTQPTSDACGIAAWIKDYRRDYPSTWPCVELFINLALSEETAVIAKRLLVRWMLPETSIEEMGSYIDSVCVGGTDG